MKYFRKSFGGRPMHRVKFFDPSNIIGKQATQGNINQTAEYKPNNNWNSLGLDQMIGRNVLERKFDDLTEIQDKVIPILLSGRDVVGVASTGSGKTAAFLLPFLQKVVNNRSEKVLILAPTRELAMQIDNEFRLFAKGTKIISALCIGGVSMGSQIYNLRRNPNFVIGTPGRLKDLAKQKFLNLKSFTNVVLDEVDRILDMGFVHDMTEILNQVGNPKQSAFFSATTTPEVVRIMGKFLHNPINVAVRANSTNSNIVQKIVKMSGNTKINTLHSLLKDPNLDKVLVFGRTKHGLNKLEEELSKRGFRVKAIHGNKSQSQRQRALSQFKNSQVKIMLATDIASRGLDINDVSHVINYDLPESYEDYIHRIGRTGRANKTGVALTLVG